jgi:hypothetical protein
MLAVASQTLSTASQLPYSHLKIAFNRFSLKSRSAIAPLSLYDRISIIGNRFAIAPLSL